LVVLFFVLLSVCALKLMTQEDPKVEQVQQLRDEFTREKTDLDRMQRECAAYAASNKAAEDQIRYLQSSVSNP
jgi:cytochrome c biogenesis protein ResB